jgi:hypothetical protein
MTGSAAYFEGTAPSFREIFAKTPSPRERLCNDTEDSWRWHYGCPPKTKRLAIKEGMGDFFLDFGF